MFWTDHALQKAQCPNREAFQEKYGLRRTDRWDPETGHALWSWVCGYVNHRIAAGETLYQVAQRYGSQVRSIVFANRIREDRGLLPGQLLQVPLPCRVVDPSLPFGTDLQGIWLDGLQARCPWLEASCLTLTAGGRPVTALRLGRGRRRVLLTAAHHGNEYITGILLWQLLERYCDGLVSGESIFGFSAAALFENTTLYLVPLVNPDGVELVTGEIGPDSREYEQARQLAVSQPGVPFPEGWKANLQGVDLNLNYPAAFEQMRQRKAAAGVTGPGPRDYPGQQPLDQPETRALAAWIETIRPHVLAAWHTQGGEIYGEDGKGRYPDEDLAKRLACVSGYSLCPVPSESRGGGLRDWFVDAFARPGFTIEAGRGENPLPLSDLPCLLEENLPIFALLLHG